MALINCPNCNKEISNKAKFCVGCGYQLINDIDTVKTINCPECGVVIDDMTDTCFNCGYPLKLFELKYNEKSKNKSLFKKKWFWVLTE